MVGFYHSICGCSTIRYTPKTVYSGNPDLPQVYAGAIGVWQRGTVRFFYPAHWVVFTLASQLIQNTSERVDTKAPQTGQLIAVIQGPSEMRVGVDPGALFDECNSHTSALTTRKLIEKLTTLTPAQSQQLKDNGITISTPETVSINGKELVYLYQSQENIENLTILIDLGNGNIPAISAYAKRGEMKQFEKQLLAIAATFEYTPPICK